MVRGGKAQFQELEVWDVTEATKYYALGSQRVALRRDNALYYLHTDHLGSTSVLTDASGQEVAGTRLKYYPYGAPRPADQVGTHNAFATGCSDATFTGQRRDVVDGKIRTRAWPETRCGQQHPSHRVVVWPSTAFVVR